MPTINQRKRQTRRETIARRRRAQPGRHIIKVTSREIIPLWYNYIKSRFGITKKDSLAFLGLSIGTACLALCVVSIHRQWVVLIFRKRQTVYSGLNNLPLTETNFSIPHCSKQVENKKMIKISIFSKCIIHIITSCSVDIQFITISKLKWHLIMWDRVVGWYQSLDSIFVDYQCLSD